MNVRSTRLWAVVAAATVLAACSGGTARGVGDKAGGDTVVLHLATIDGDVNFGGQAYGPQAFVDALTAVSGGRLRVEVEKTYGDRTADAESRLVKAIASGALDGGWPATRAFDGAGITGLEAVETPMTITNYAAEKESSRGPSAPSCCSNWTALASSGSVSQSGRCAGRSPRRARCSPWKTGRASGSVRTTRRCRPTQCAPLVANR